MTRLMSRYGRPPEPAQFSRLLERLPAPQREALKIVFGLTQGPAPDRFLLGWRYSACSRRPRESAPFCVSWMTRSGWIGRRPMLAFAARRLLAERVGFVSGSAGKVRRSGAPELEVRGLGAEDARVLPKLAGPFSLGEQVRDRIVAETGGNPLALLELPRGLTAAQLAGGFGLPGAQVFRGGSRRASLGGSRPCPKSRSDCCCSRPPSRRAIRCWCGARPSGSGSPLRRRSAPRRTDC